MPDGPRPACLQLGRSAQNLRSADQQTNRKPSAQHRSHRGNLIHWKKNQRWPQTQSRALCQQKKGHPVVTPSGKGGPIGAGRRSGYPVRTDRAVHVLFLNHK
ncbi:hypothetical protein psal_cds_1278 [Pandoravirus salinus]|uniref:Uncharacterized protein n=1 Tax=Pandoravirus salinus TaxID=1349410 RepID=S4VY76_9VIRU|nr:hypothetical protein psal_cds_1278 [Pandoravirus salinus]AGO85634.2 hypothetical protein psal_cds_1278 [Pandoravirus salinus]